MTWHSRVQATFRGIAFMLIAVLGATAWFLPNAGAKSGVMNEPTVIAMDPEISWFPEEPGEGRLFRVRLQASVHTPIMGVHGSVEGEELHFERAGEREFQSLAAVPLGSDGAVTAVIRVVYASGSEEILSRRIPVTPGVYAHERLRVAPRFGTPLDSTDTARLAGDQAMATEASRLAHRTPRGWSEVVIMPRAGRVTSNFGDGREFNGQISSRHMGLDLQGLHGDTVLAATRGTVILVEPFLLAGNIVYVNHGGGLLSAYFHLSRQLVEVGDTVEAGEPVGLVGATGRVTGPHLHWVVRYGRTSVDPRSLLEVMEPR